MTAPRRAETTAERRLRLRRRQSGYEPSGSPRTLRLTDKGRAAIGVPLPPVMVPLLDLVWLDEEATDG